MKTKKNELVPFVIPEGYKESMSFTLKILGETIECDYSPYLEYIGHLEFHGVTSETGYRSHFFHFEPGHKECCLQEYATEIATKLIVKVRKSRPPVKKHQNQLSLF